VRLTPWPFPVGRIAVLCNVRFFALKKRDGQWHCLPSDDVETGKKISYYRGRRKKKEDEQVQGGCLTSFSKIILNPHFCLGHIGVVTCLSLSSDGNYLASGGEDKTIRLWDTRSQKLIETFRGHRNGVSVRSGLSLTIQGISHPHPSITFREFHFGKEPINSIHAP